MTAQMTCDWGRIDCSWWASTLRGRRTDEARNYIRLWLRGDDATRQYNLGLCWPWFVVRYQAVRLSCPSSHVCRRR